MKTRYGVSPWVHAFPQSRVPDFPSLRGDHTADVVIIGGGLTGCAAAYSCAAAGLTTLLLETDRVGQGMSGRSAGLLLPEPGPMFRDVVQAHGLRAGRQVFETWRRGSLDAAALLRRLKIKCGLEPLSSLTVAGRGDADPLLRREFDARSGAGLTASWLTARQLEPATKLDATAAIRHREAFTIDPYRATLGMAAAARARRARLFERSRVKKVTFTRKDATVSTEHATIRTSKVIVATGSATAEYGQLRRHFSRREMYLVATEPLPAAIRRQLVDEETTFRDLHTPRRRVRWADGGRILIAGADQHQPPERQREATRVQRTGQLMYELLTMYPAISGVQPEYGWELPYGETADGLMYIGPHRNYPHHVFALGGTTDSVTGSFLAARIATRMAQGVFEKPDEVFGFTR